MAGFSLILRRMANSPDFPAPTPLPTTLNQVSAEWLRSQLMLVEGKAGKDVVVIIGGILHGLDLRVRVALEQLEERKKSLLVILNTQGGIVEVAKRISDTLRYFYQTVDFLIPNEAMSAGTVLALSGDAIQMDYFSRLGPIDPQVVREGRLVPGLSYLRQYESLIEKSKQGELTEAELTLLNKLDLAELHQIQLAAGLSVTLIQDWLPRYKFKDWAQHKDGTKVTQAEKEARAEEIATELNDHQRWHTHSRGIDMETLRGLKLKIDDFGENPELGGLIWRYFWAAQEYMQRFGYHNFVQTRGFV